MAGLVGSKPTRKRCIYMNVVVTPSARERFTPRELGAAYEDFSERGPQYLNAHTGLSASAYRFGERVLIVCDEPQTGVVVLATLEEQAEAEKKKKKREGEE
jgi:hypothetical protein